MIRFCIGCGAPLPLDARPNRLRCKRHCGRRSKSANGARTKARASNVTHFVAVDGEGVDRLDGAHDYNLLSVGERSLHNPDGSVLALDDILSFLWRHHLDNPGSTYVGFFLGYDFAQWFRQLPEERARMMLTEEGAAARRRVSSGGNTVPFPVQWHGWEMDLMAGKRFKLRRENSGEPWLYLCDAGSFFQSSLLKAIDPSSWPEPVCSDDEYRIVEEGKSDRGRAPVPYGTPVDQQTIDYNVVENRILVRLMDRYNAGLVAMGLKLKRNQWFGPGQAAQAWLSQTAPEHTGAEVRAVTPTEVLDAAQATYYGGWFEIMVHGPIPGEIYGYDINSAYPHQIAQLPCLLHGEWRHGAGPSVDRGELTMVYAAVEGSSVATGPLPFRNPKGRVLRPNRTTGWYWLHEVEAAADAGLVDVWTVEEWWSYDACGCQPPFAQIAELYDRRVEVGSSTPEGKALKLVYNSAYGKMAQSVGQPKFSNAIYASLITAGCRVQILEAIASHPDGSEVVVMVATDAVYFLTPHELLNQSSALGDWGDEPKSNLSLFKPGMYWDDKARDRINSGELDRVPVRSRGINAKALASCIGDIDIQWGIFDGENWPEVEVIIPFGVISLKQALHRNDWPSAGKIIHNTVAKQSADPSNKRYFQPNDIPGAFNWSAPYIMVGDGITTPYDRRFGAELEERVVDIEVLTQDGDFLMFLDEALGLD